MAMTRRALDQLLAQLEEDLPRTMSRNNGDFFLQVFKEATDFIVDLADPIDAQYVRERAAAILKRHGLGPANDSI